MAEVEVPKIGARQERARMNLNAILPVAEEVMEGGLQSARRLWDLAPQSDTVV